MKRTLTAIAIIVTLLTVTTVPSCEKKGDPTGPALFIATVLILGITVGGWFEEATNDQDFPPDKYDILPRYGENVFVGSILSGGENDWYRTDMLREGERFTIWSESNIGLRAVIIDEYGDYYSSTNYAPGSDFHMEIEARDWMSYFVLVTAHDEHASGPYELHWRYGY